MQEENILIQAGLSEEQAQVYQSLLEKGPQKASDLSKWTGIKRGLIYKVLEQLESLSLVSKTGGPGTVATFSPAHPSLLLSNIERKEKEIALNKELLQSSIGSLSSKYNLIIGKPNIQFFEGEEGLDKIGDDSLAAEGEILSYIDNEAVHKYIPDFNARYKQQRKNKAIKKRMLALDSEFIRLNKEKYLNYDLTEIRLVSSPTPFDTVMQIYDNKVSYISLDEKKIICVLIADEHISKMHRTLFEALWAKSTPLYEI